MNAKQIQHLMNDAVAHHRAGKLEMAGKLYAQVRRHLPNNFDAVHLSGLIEMQLGRPVEAAELLTRAIKINPRDAVCAMGLGVALGACGKFREAERYGRLSVQLDPKSAEGWSNLAECLKSQDRLTEAIECHERALTLKPDFGRGWYNYGIALSFLGRYADALRAHDRAIAAHPSYAKGYYGRAQALQLLCRIPEAVAAYDHFLTIEPACHEARSYRLLALNYLDSIPRAQVFAEHLKYSQAIGEFPVPDFRQSPVPDRRLRVAVFSPDLRQHSCMYFLEPILRHLDPARFELCLYHDSFREDAVSARLKTRAAVWRNFVGQTNPLVEQTIRADAPDIIIDLAGHTGMSDRQALFARHLAPVQINYLGYPNTTGLSAMHYRFTDAIADPEGDSDAFASEELVRYSACAWVYQPSDGTPEVNVLPGDTERPVTFGCFNNISKINDPMLALWARILAAVPASRLLVKGWGVTAAADRERYLARFAAAGLPADRVDLCERTPGISEHLVHYHRADIALDPYPYHGTTTTCESLWMGVPVVTLRGDRHASRVGPSLLTAAGHPEWIARSADDYVRIAVELASDRTRLAAIRGGLRNEMKASALFDYSGQGERFGSAIRRCWRAYCSRVAARAVA